MKKSKFDLSELEFDIDTLDDEERQIVKDIKAGLYQPVKALEKRKSELAEYAKNMLEKIKKEKNINIRLTEKDLDRLKSKATKSGLPYQTLIGILIRQYNDNKIEIKV